MTLTIMMVIQLLDNEYNNCQSAIPIGGLSLMGASDGDIVCLVCSVGHVGYMASIVVI